MLEDCKRCLGVRLAQRSNIVKSLMGCEGAGVILFEKGNHDISCVNLLNSLYVSYFIIHPFIITFMINKKHHNISKISEKVLKPNSTPLWLHFILTLSTRVFI